MKIPFFKTILVAGALLTVCGCGDDTPSKSDDKNDSQAIVVSQASWVFEKDGQQYLIGVDGVVTDMDGKQVGVADMTNPSSTYIVAMDMTSFAKDIDISKLEVVTPTVITSTAWVISAGQTYVLYPAAPEAIDESGTGAGIVTDASGNQVGYFIYNSTSGKVVGMDLATVIVDNVEMSTLKAYLPNVAPSSSSAAPIQEKSSSSVAQQQTAKSSSSAAQQTAKSSSSQQQAKSSSSAQQGGSNISYTIKYISGGKEGDGYATRYWDCCEPHCAWPEHGGKASTCDAKGNKVQGGTTSMCDGGNAGICRNQFPFAVNDTLAFAFAATPGGENNCGKCFDLAFTGKGKYASDNNIAKLKGKHLIVMSSNVGYDVSGGQFDVMIPGGGFGIFNGCGSKMGWGSQGSQYGGLLDECEKETNYTASKYKSCLTEKCNKSFSGDPEAKEGCLFLANWMNAAGNPLHHYREVECPKELIDRF